MLYNLLKAAISGGIVLAVSEVAQRSSLFGALVASLPLTSVLAFVWLYRDTADASRVAELSYQVFWLVIPSLAFFLVFPWLVGRGFDFWSSLGLGALATVLAYLAMVPLVGRLSPGA